MTAAPPAVHAAAPLIPAMLMSPLRFSRSCGLWLVFLLSFLIAQYANTLLTLAAKLEKNTLYHHSQNVILKYGKLQMLFL
jgi:hypothetical protein